MRRVVVPSVALAVGVAVALGAVPAAEAAGGPLDEVRDAMAKAAFTGRMQITWVDHVGTHRTDVTVRAARGAMEVDGPTPIMRFGSSRFVRMSTGWTSMWPDAGVGRPPPDGGAKYAVATTPGPAVAGRPTTGVEVRAGTRVRERLAVDTETGVLLRRQQLDDRGRVVRQLEFATFEPTPPALHLPPQRFRADGATSTRAAALQAPYRAPAGLPRGYARLGTYRRGDVLQVVYGDGLYGLSVFEQPGRIDWSQLPRDGRTVEVAGHPGRSYVWPGGHLVTWQGGRAAYTIVGDGPEADVLAAAASIRGAAALSTAQRMRQAARELVSTLSGRG